MVRSMSASLFILTIFAIDSSIPVPNGTFNFPLGPSAVYTAGASFEKFRFFVGANTAVANNDFAVSRASRDFSEFKFVGLTPANIKLNNVEKQNNPLNGAKIDYMSLIVDLPVVVKDGNNSVYFFKNSYDIKNIELLSTGTPNDSNFQPISNILSLTSYGADLAGSRTFVAVQDNAGNPFGQGNSGIALIGMQSQEIVSGNKNKKEQDEQKKYAIVPIIFNADSSDSSTTSNKAAPLTNSTPALMIGNPVNINSNIVDMHFDNVLQRLYIAVSLTSNAAGNSGARAVVVGRLLNNKIYFDPIAPDSVFNLNNQIVGTGQSSSNVSILKVRTMITSTLLSYLIVLGGNDIASNVNNTVYSLPLVNHNMSNTKISNDSTHGTLAQFSQIPTSFYSSNFFNGRAFTQPAAASTDVLTSSSKAAIVGNGPLPLSAGQNVQDLKVINDSVFASIADNYNGTTQPGIFYSQAIFDSNGVIQSWTPWKRTMGSSVPVTGFALDLLVGNFWFMTGSDSTNINSVQKTLWSNGNNDNLLSNAISLFDNSFPQNKAGINKLVDFPVSTAGFNNVSLLIGTGYDNIAILESGSAQSGFYKPNTGNFSANSTSGGNGTFVANPGTKYVSISGGALKDIGPINSADIITQVSANEHWIIVGGVFGLAILCDSSGNSWIGDITNLSDIPAGLQFKKIGNYSFVQKIKNDGTFLYVLTDNKLDRINIASSDFSSGNLSIVTLASYPENSVLGNAYFDFAKSDKFGLLATSVGLFRVGNNSDITSASNSSEVNWTNVNVPQALGPISKLFIVSSTNSENDFAFNGQIYTLNNYRGFNISRLNRFFVNLGSSIDNNTILSVPDMILQNSLSSYLDFGIFKDGVFIDGSLIACFNSKDSNLQRSLNIILPFAGSGTRYYQVKSIGISLDVPLDSVQINGIIRNSASGAIILNGDFGLRVNE